ncbi:MAG: GNAT family N-acetyltransferase, partial [Gammaproteobacteria bacterium]
LRLWTASIVDIRRARIEDLPAIKTVLAMTWHDTYASLLCEASIAKVAAQWHSPAVLEAEINSASTFPGVAKDIACGIVGMITAHSHGEVLSVARLYVVPEFQRQGVGKRLMEESCRAFPQTKRVTLDVEKRNPKGRAFYRKLGFEEVGVKSDNVAGTRLDSIMMEKHIA